MKLLLLILCVSLFSCSNSLDENCLEEISDTTTCNTRLSTDSLLTLADKIKIRYNNNQNEFVVNLDSLQHLYDDKVNQQSLTDRRYHEAEDHYKEQLAINEELKKPRIRRKDSIIYNYITVDTIIHIRDTFRFVDTINYTYEFYFNAIMNDTTENYRKKKRKWKKMIEKLNK
ncbi:MAG: hypothetical protein CMH79_05085 [Nitrospinae bacterium]|nr:hypothetical protein [Nitrospinota bacterium]|tara:strand:- start:216 stop:731 length:516 start_codon:yes stop_codon:yes gene_type:complete